MVILIGYHFACAAHLRKLRDGVNEKSHVYFRLFNEVPVLFLVAIVILVIVKPFVLLPWSTDSISRIKEARTTLSGHLPIKRCRIKASLKDNCYRQIASPQHIQDNAALILKLHYRHHSIRNRQ